MRRKYSHDCGGRVNGYMKKMKVTVVVKEPDDGGEDDVVHGC